MARVLMEPDQPPLPTAWYLPFHPFTGSQTSTLMSELLDGRRVSDRRQAGGSPLTSADVTLARGKESAASCSQDPACAGHTARNISIDAFIRESCRGPERPDKRRRTRPACLRTSKCYLLRTLCEGSSSTFTGACRTGTLNVTGSSALCTQCICLPLAN